MDPLQIIAKYYPAESPAFHILHTHSMAVARMAIEKASSLGLTEIEIEFIHEAALLHDIGIFQTDAPDIGCHGDLPYICHGYLGHDLLLAEGLPKHALVCERHTGTGLSLRDIDKFNGLLPRRSMEPVSLAEELITYCDKFFSKDPGHLEEKRSFVDVLENIRQYGDDKANTFTEWHRKFNP